MHDLATIILLGIIEGLTEFLPVSSTGHLILASEMLGFTGEGSAAFKIAIQLGAILAVLVAYRARFWGVGMGLLRADPAAVAFTRNILIGFLPAMLVGAVAYEGVRALLESPATVAVALLVGGIAILAIERMVKVVKVESVEAMPLRTAIAIGAVQCIAMIPGVSRSGATIMGALLMGVERRTAAEFSFFLAVPTMMGATAYSLWKDRAILTFDDMNAIAIGLFVAFLVALVVVKAFVAIVGRFGFAPFAWYRIIVGGGALLWLAWK
ncbi:undecaprenyl-diphosphate phosphatase [Sphingopyxis alaskensis]|jgi:undecaprenyl-diphosphatase|uniref:Undecaprenyl-diphosphatase n=1 Tax=Sphingopyxis alaskensis (strain DSM 13593 / LMG 18877 / RB2256) TaxID=317655 RepID=UPPP_SPHAL|nr:undecaprenyl-diphosphate phosphatase [Sphingopyxis alaskensis]Q1GR76.1 RecName: Full=Undecaprenyl-diphosphatase; AltName: Full=Bacitracin resistance protein; AltName: Full=Undecaprenyl pyrophosphate phosphatase [Sphingopyxis alaskensis RB2256]ABF53846.1 Undecaprenyl-diphosphatase [Sphingopyxis alaskensis RB2256]MCM3420627.1 undecaprenyl-diphosphate phosphatase [Sphingopyxis alaskensis]